MFWIHYSLGRLDLARLIRSCCEPSSKEKLRSECEWEKKKLGRVVQCVNGDSRLSGGLLDITRKHFSLVVRPGDKKHYWDHSLCLLNNKYHFFTKSNAFVFLTPFKSSFYLLKGIFVEEFCVNELLKILWLWCREQLAHDVNYNCRN